jgi:hypothetical protein
MPRRDIFPAVVAGLLLVASSLAVARGFAEAPPQGVDLNGTWTLNTAQSDDPRKILEAERAKRRGRRAELSPFAKPHDRGDEIDMPATVTIAHSAGRFSISSPTPSGEMQKSEYRAGTKSVVSVRNGVADRNVGWKGKTFIISTRAIDGAHREDRYSLDKEGRLLVVTETREEGMPRREIERLYDRATQALRHRGSEKASPDAIGSRDAAVRRTT